MKTLSCYSILVIVLILLGCITQPVITDSLRSDEVPSYIVNTDQKSLKIDDRITIFFDDYTFFDSEKQEFITGEIKINFIFLDTYSEYIDRGLNTQTEYGVLKSDGVLFFKATQGEEDLTINPNSPVQIKLDKSIDFDMRLYEGVIEEETLENWELINQPVVQTDTLVAGIQFFSDVESDLLSLDGEGPLDYALEEESIYSILTIDRLGWTNIDYLLKLNNLVPMEFTIRSGPSLDYYSMSFLFRDSLVVINEIWDGRVNKISLPVNTDMAFYITSANHSPLYGDYDKFKVKKGETVYIDLEKITDEKKQKIYKDMDDFLGENK